jgi:hypothetical protein
VGDAEALGFSSSRLARIAAWQQTQVDAGAFSGAVAAIARNGKVAYLRAVGFRDRARTIPLQPDAIFWIASMTKPVTSVAATARRVAWDAERRPGYLAKTLPDSSPYFCRIARYVPSATIEESARWTACRSSTAGGNRWPRILPSKRRRNGGKP